MSLWVMKKCCCCVDLRLGSFLIAYITLVLRVSVLIIISIHLSDENSTIQHGVHSIAAQDPLFQRSVHVISMIILLFEILLGIALLVGLYKRLDQHVEMYYVCGLAFMVMELIVYAVVLMRYARLLYGWVWAVVAVEICMKLILVYSLAVIRSFYYKMREEIKDEQHIGEVALKNPSKYLDFLYGIAMTKMTTS